MFRFTRKPSSDNHSQYLPKITHLVQCGYVEPVQDVIIVGCILQPVRRVYCALCEGILYTVYSIPSLSAQYTRLTGHNMQLYH